MYWLRWLRAWIKRPIQCSHCGAILNSNYKICKNGFVCLDYYGCIERKNASDENLINFIEEISELENENNRLEEEIAYWKVQFGNVMAPKGEHDGKPNVF